MPKSIEAKVGSLCSATFTTIWRLSQGLASLCLASSVTAPSRMKGSFKAFFATTSSAKDNLIIDARPAANAYANQALGMGTENMEFYPNCTREFMGIENIHVVRDSLNKLVEAICSPGAQTVISKIQLSRSNWLKHIRSILDGVQKIVHHVHDLNSHVLVHCSDGWDRTAQLTAGSEICLDPYYRTIRGFATLIEKEFVSFGFKFRSRCGHLCKSKSFVDNSLVALNHTSSPSLLSNMQNRFLQYSSARPSQDKETCPIFHQFLDCTFQLWIQNPTAFEFNEKLLLFLYEQVYACQYGTFLFDCEMEMRTHPGLTTKTYSIWSHVFSNIESFLNPIYTVPAPDTPRHVLVPETKYLRYWSSLFCRRDEDLNCLPSPLHSPSEGSLASEAEGTAAMLFRAGSRFLMELTPSGSQSFSSDGPLGQPLDLIEESVEEYQVPVSPPKESPQKSGSASKASSPRNPKEKLLTKETKRPSSFADCISLTSSPRSAASNTPSRSASLSSSHSEPASHNYDYSHLAHPLETFATD
ncbi:phosphatidylinositol-3-phosphatase ymr1 [Entomophthora muscae]|uniref:Phosphatidylinositol-3-phosphatase ymr1 n=1 Tax=Entomophthora muscae TaxID=34485 RepID=A0ACC2US60_9FUNG|nr:phosphatidylinositol-3-phosphatase ymr1 [Entomophthora muscae]